MGRRRSVVTEFQRALVRQQRAAEQARRAAIRAAEQQQRAQERALREAQSRAAADEQERKRRYIEQRQAEAAVQTAQVKARTAELETLLTSTLHLRTHIPFASLRRSVDVPPFEPGELGVPLRERQWEEFAPHSPSTLGRLLGGKARFERERVAAWKKFEEARTQQATAEQERQRCLAEQEQEYARVVAEAEEEVRKHNAAVDEFEAAFHCGNPDQVEEYFARVLSAFSYPEGFPHRFRLAYRPEPKELIVEYELPPQSVVPQQRAFPIRPEA
jgi:restriction system protein